MTWPLTPDEVAALAPDAMSVRAARPLSVPRSWASLGCDQDTVWGLASGSGAAPYQVAVDRRDGRHPPRTRCSCPSRKVPCKHALGLLLLWAERPEAVPAGEPPPWVAGWLAAPAPSPGGGAGRRPAARPPADPEARAERMAARAERIAGGLEELDRWLRDLVRQGLAWAQSQPYAFWDQVAARMVDAQAPGAGSAVRRLAGAAYAGGDWPGRLLERAGRLWLLTAAWPRRDTFRDDVRADLRTAVGWAWSREEVLAGPRLRDEWQVVGQVVTEEERVRARRTWLLGAATARAALVLEFTPLGAGFPADYPLGCSIDADIAFYPGSAPVRALVAERRGEPQPLGLVAGATTIEEGLAAFAATLARNPWSERVALALDGVVPVAREGRWWVRDARARLLPIAGDQRAWRLVALSGGAPLPVFGEWDGTAFTPLSAFAWGRMVAL